MVEKSNRQFKCEVRMRICAILDCSKDRALNKKEEKEMTYLVNLLDPLKGTKSKKLPFRFDFNNFTVKEYLSLRGNGYKVEEIRRMCGVSKYKYYQWRKEHDLLVKNKKA